MVEQGGIEISKCKHERRTNYILCISKTTGLEVENDCQKHTVQTSEN